MGTMTENQIEGLSESFTREEYNSQEIFDGEMQRFMAPIGVLLVLAKA